MYPEEMVAPMRQEAIDIGCQELKTADDVTTALGAGGTAFVLVNSVCGCAAGMARPGLDMALKNSDKKPDQVYTVFAGVDKEATEAARKFFLGYPPSSPSMALLKDGEILGMVERHDIEGHGTKAVAAAITELFETHC